MAKEDAVYTYDGALFSHEKKGNSAVCDMYESLKVLC